MKKHDFWTRTNNNNKSEKKLIKSHEKNAMNVGDLSQI
jgi:hypothetical protein